MKLCQNLMMKITEEHGQDEYNKDVLFHKYRLKILTIATTYDSWMRKLGLNYNPRKKCYYVDSHKSSENIKRCKDFISQYWTQTYHASAM